MKYKKCKFCGRKTILWRDLRGKPTIWECIFCPAEYNIYEEIWIRRK